MSSTVNGDKVRMLRHARGIVDDMRWRGMAVPPVYASMADEFQTLVRTGKYAAWIADFGRSGPPSAPRSTTTPFVAR